MAKYGLDETFWSGRRVLVTGATGMVGSWLVKDLLAAGAYVVALVRDTDPHSEFFRSGDYLKTHIVTGTLEDYPAIERSIIKHEVDTVFHLAAQAIVGTAYRAPLSTFETNVRGTYQLLELCRANADLVQRVVIASSDKAYGAQETLPYTEDMSLQGHYPYEVSKSCADLIAQSYYHTYGLPVAIARCGNIYGGGDLNWSRIVPGTIRSLLHQEAPIVRSDGTFVRDYVYVKDVSCAYMSLAEKLSRDDLKGHAFNFGPERPLSVLELVTIIQHLLGCERLKPDIRNAAVGEIRSQYLSSEKANRLLDWRPHFTLETGLSETIAWYRDFFGNVTE